MYKNKVPANLYRLRELFVFCIKRVRWEDKFLFTIRHSGIFVGTGVLDGPLQNEKFAQNYAENV